MEYVPDRSEARGEAPVQGAYASSMAMTRGDTLKQITNTNKLIQQQVQVQWVRETRACGSPDSSSRGRSFAST